MTAPGPDILQRIRTWLADLLGDLGDALTDPDGAALLLRELGWAGEVPSVPDALTQLGSSATAGDGDATEQGLESLGQIVLALSALVEAMVASAGTTSTAGDVTSAAEIVADMLDLAIALKLRDDHPAAWAILRLLNLLSDDGFELGNLADLVGDSHQYLSGLVRTAGYQQVWQDYSLLLAAVGAALAFIPPIGPPEGAHLYTEVLYGWTEPPGDTAHQNLYALLDRALTVRLAGQVAPDKIGIDPTLDLTFLLVPPEHNSGSWGLFLRAGGTTAAQVTLGSGWDLSITMSDAAEFQALFAANGFAAVDVPGWNATLALERPDQQDGAWIVGDATKSHLEIQHARVFVGVADNGGSWSFSTGLHTDHVTVVIQLGGDSFLSAVLPSKLSMDSQIGILFDVEHGLSFEGGIALGADLPVHLSLGPAEVVELNVQALHLRIALGTGGGSNDPTSANGPHFDLSFTVDANVQIAGGTVSASVAGIGIKGSVTEVAPTDAAPASLQPSVDFVPPHGLGIAINAGPVGGGGFIDYDADRHEYSGALQLHLALGFSVDIAAIAILDTEIPDHPDDWAFLLILSAAFTPGIQLGLGFYLGGVGGMLGINHSVDTDAIAAGLRTHSLDAMLFPPDPVGQAPHIFATLRQTMPITDGHIVVGPALRLAWGGLIPLVQLDIALLFEFDPALVQIVLLGRLLVAVPHPDLPLVKLRADIVGSLKFSPFDLTLEAELVDSNIATFAVTGGLAIVARTGADGCFVLSIGGFNPHFTPPSGVPVVDRLRIDISPSPNPRLRLECYLAITSQTFQIGARAEFHASAGPLALDGWLGLDVLIAWLPHFRFSAEISAGLSLSYDGSPVLEVSIDVLLEGPGPWHVHGSAELHLLFFTLSIPVDATWGEPTPATASTTDPLTLLNQAIATRDAWSAAPPDGTANLISFRPYDGADVPAHPLSVLSCTQKAVPLGLAVTHVSSQPLAAPTTLDITGLTLGGTDGGAVGTVTDDFAAGQFLDLSDDAALSRPSFERMKAGVSLGSGAAVAGNATAASTAYKTVVVDQDVVNHRFRWPLEVAHATSLLASRAAPTRSAPVRVGVVADALRQTSSGGTVTAALAAQVEAHDGVRLLDGAGMAVAP